MLRRSAGSCLKLGTVPEGEAFLPDKAIQTWGSDP